MCAHKIFAWAIASLKCSNTKVKMERKRERDGMRRSCKIGISFSNDLFILAILSVAIYKANTFAHTGACIVCTPTLTHTFRGKMKTKRKQKQENEQKKWQNRKIQSVIIHRLQFICVNWLERTIAIACGVRDVDCDAHKHVIRFWIENILFSQKCAQKNCEKCENY